MANAAERGLAVLTGRAGSEPADDREAAQPSPAAIALEGHPAALDRVLASVRHKWGQHSVVRLDEVLAARDGAPRRPQPAIKRRRELPPWWPVTPSASLATAYGAVDSAGAVRRPHLLEMIGESGTGRLSLAMAWLAAARPALAAIVEPTRLIQPASAGFAPIAGGFSLRSKIAEPWPTQFYPPAARSAGVDLRQLVLVRPPAGEPRGALDAVATLLRSQAFDVVLCSLPAGARISLLFGGKLATLAARSGTTLLLLTAPSRAFVTTARSGRSGRTNQGNRGDWGVLGAFADYRVRLTARRWLWIDREIAGMKLRVATERARVEAEMENDGAPPEYELTLHLQRRAHHGNYASQGDEGIRGTQGVCNTPLREPHHLEPGAADRLYLAAAVRVEHRQPAGSAAFSDDAGDIGRSGGAGDDGALPAGHALGSVAGMFA